MDDLIDIVGLMVVVALGSALASRLRISSPILLVLVGVALSFVPGVLEVSLNPQLILNVVLPLLLYAAAINTSLPAFRRAVRPIALLAVGLVFFTAVVVGFAAHTVVPGLPLAATFVLGAIVAPPDAVAATAIARRVGLPRRLVTVLEGESLLNDATSLVIYRVAVGATLSGTFSIAQAGWSFLIASAGGVAVGIATAWGVGWIRRRVEDSIYDNTLSLLTPFLAYVPAESIGASGLVAVVIAGLLLGYRSPVLMSAEARMQIVPVWRVIEFLLQGVVFLLMGLQLRDIVQGIEGQSMASIATTSVAIVLCVIAARFAWVFPATYLARLVRGGADRPAPWRYPAVISWAGMRGVVSLAMAFALPFSTSGGAPFPQRDTLVFLTFVVIFATLVLQGLTLPLLIRRLGLPRPDPLEDAREAAEALHEATAAARERLNSLIEDSAEGLSSGVIERVKDYLEYRSIAAHEVLEPRYGESSTAQYRRLLRAMLQTEREVFVQMRDEGRLDDEVLRALQGVLDFEEVLLRKDRPPEPERGRE